MYRISELAELLGLSRTTLLYYEKIGLISGKRQSNGYRSYSELDVQRLRLIQQLQGGGLTLKECKACLEAKVDRQVLLERLNQLDEEIVQKQKSRQLLGALLGESRLTEWHESLDKVAPEAHLAWLISQGFSEKEALRLRWLSKDMNKHDCYMADFNKVFTPLDRWGPGSEKETLLALSKVPFKSEAVLEIGCGQGIATTVLAKHSSAHITALDNHENSLSRLMDRAKKQGLAERVTTVCASMTDMPFEAESFDLIWSECSAYIMGVANALKQWRSLLTSNGILVLSDLVWSTDSPSEDALSFWQKEYPDMTSVKERTKQAKEGGYEVLDSFALSEDAWAAYYEPLQSRVNELKSEMPHSDALHDLEAELDIYHRRLSEFDYQMFILKKA
ncbi:MerR family transcriptional regulator [Photobacterium sp. J15]|uniref:MerR family transcriptional regulator n=1 Tax=Photobacterium sp. J15 TaxID=265901 RepID=UPI0007E43158|nr:MerR family transcriptional regulator [Photobacterium sp. J15]